MTTTVVALVAVSTVVTVLVLAVVIVVVVDRVERLTNLLALLLETNEPLSLIEIAGELRGQYPEGEVARRQAFERDKAAWRDIGVPIEQEIVRYLREHFGCEFEQV